MAKSERTKQKLYETALNLFLKDGFEKTTMRSIAGAAGVAPGAIYYYFDSKESVVQEYYHKSHAEHEEVIKSVLQNETSFEKRLHIVVRSKIEISLPYKKVVRALYKAAADPLSPSSPFSEESKELRLKAVKIFEDVVINSNDKFHSDIKKLLPKYLWFYQMGIVLFWIYDNSENSKKTFELIDKTVPLLVWFNSTMQSPWAAPFRKKIINTLKSFEPSLN